MESEAIHQHVVLKLAAMSVLKLLDNRTTKRGETFCETFWSHSA